MAEGISEGLMHIAEREPAALIARIATGAAAVVTDLDINPTRVFTGKAMVEFGRLVGEISVELSEMGPKDAISDSVTRHPSVPGFRPVRPAPDPDVVALSQAGEDGQLIIRRD
jgi:hypothetical protein